MLIPAPERGKAFSHAYSRYPLNGEGAPFPSLSVLLSVPEGPVHPWLLHIKPLGLKSS